jgi:hypothetical protein
VPRLVIVSIAQPSPSRSRRDGTPNICSMVRAPAAWSAYSISTRMSGRAPGGVIGAD